MITSAREAYDLLVRELWDWLAAHGHTLAEDGEYEVDLTQLYNNDLDYLWWTALWHAHPVVQSWLDGIAANMSAARVLDLGTGNGFTGLTIALLTSAQVVFSDFDATSLGSQFIRDFCEVHDLTYEIRSYQDLDDTEYDIVIAADVLEHTGNHPAALRWFARLGKEVHICYPISVPWAPPYIKRVDDWVDDELIMIAIAARYNLLGTIVSNRRRFVSYQRRG